MVRQERKTDLRHDVSTSLVEEGRADLHAVENLRDAPPPVSRFEIYPQQSEICALIVPTLRKV
jgi:hypothetical protein